MLAFIFAGLSSPPSRSPSARGGWGSKCATSLPWVPPNRGSNGKRGSSPTHLPMSANVCQCLPMSANLCQSLPVSASVCQCVPVSAILCHRLPISAILCRPVASSCVDRPVTARRALCFLAWFPALQPSPSQARPPPSPSKGRPAEEATLAGDGQQRLHRKRPGRRPSSTPTTARTVVSQSCVTKREV
jgi:hypothetical protein